MAESPHKSVPNTILANLRAYERLLSAKTPISNAETRPDARHLIQRLEHIIADQEDRVKRMGHQSIGSPSETHRLRASMKDVLATYRRTLQQIRQSAVALELSWSLDAES